MIGHKIQSIKGKKNLDSVFKQALKFWDKNATIFILFTDNAQLHTSEYAAIAVKRVNRKAVIRNRIKRLIRQSLLEFSKKPNISYPFYIEKIIVVWHSKIDHPGFISLKRVHDSIAGLIERALKYCNSHKRVEV